MARPRVNPKYKMKQTSITMPAPLLEKMQFLSKHFYVNWSAVARIAVATEVRKLEARLAEGDTEK